MKLINYINETMKLNLENKKLKNRKEQVLIDAIKNIGKAAKAAECCQTNHGIYIEKMIEKFER